MIGIDISDKSIKVAEVSEGRMPRLRAVGWGALPAEAVQRGIIKDAEMVLTQLQEVLLRSSPVPVTGKRVVASISEIQSFVSMVEVPSMSRGEMDEAVQWAVQQNIPFDLERVYLDWQPLPATDKGKVRVLVGAAQREVVDPLLYILDSLGLTPVALELEAQSIVRSLLPLSSADIQGVLIVDLGAVSSNIIFFDQGSMRFTASVPEGGDLLTTKLAGILQIPPEMAAERKALVGVSRQAADQTVAEPLRAAMKALLTHVAQVSREVVRQVGGGTTIETILLAGGAANLQGLSEVFTEVMPGIPVQLGNPWTNLLAEGQEGEAPLSGEDAAHFATALGLALRRSEYE